MSISEVVEDIFVSDDAGADGKFVCPHCQRPLKLQDVPICISGPVRDRKGGELAYYVDIQGWHCYFCDQSIFHQKVKTWMEKFTQKMLELEKQMKDLESNLVRGS